MNLHRYSYHQSKRPLNSLRMAYNLKLTLELGSTAMITHVPMQCLLPAAKPRRSMDHKPPPPPGKIESLEAFRGQRSMVA